MSLEIIKHGSVDIDLRYSTSDNITGKKIYARPVALLHPEANAALNRAADYATRMGFRLRIYDAYRPVSAQQVLWDTLPDPRFIADPAIGSTHSRGIAVDLGLANEAGELCDMGTAFDDMTEQSFHGDMSQGGEAQFNRTLLLGIMVATGWMHQPYEWWHYNLPNEQTYPIIDEPAVTREMMSLTLA